MYLRVECYFIEGYYRVCNILCVAATDDTLKGEATMEDSKVIDIIVPVGEKISVLDLAIKAGGFNG